MMRLTVAMATYDDPNLRMTVQSLRAMHGGDFDELVVVNNHPAGDGAKALERFVGKAGGKYVPMESPTGTAAPRDRAIAESTGDVRVVIDPHVLLAPGALHVVRDHFSVTDHDRDLISGPLLSDDLVTVTATHMEPRWRKGSWGTWAVDDRLLSEPGEVWAMGLGAFAVRRDAWPGFGPHRRGFGGVEGVLHERVRRAGGRCVCLPGLRWAHPEWGTRKYRDNTWEDRLWNYALGHVELQLSPAKFAAEYLGRKLVTPAQWERAFREAHAVLGVDVPPRPRGAGEHLADVLRELGIDEEGEDGVACENCKALRARMNRWGPAACRDDHMGEITGALRDAAKNRGWEARAAAGVKALATGIALEAGNPLRWRDPFATVVYIAVRRAETAIDKR